MMFFAKIVGILNRDPCCARVEGHRMDESRVYGHESGAIHSRRFEQGMSGYTYLELVATAGILLILASAILPLARVTVKRQKEIELRRSLREMRLAIDRYKAAVDADQMEFLGSRFRK